MGKTKSIFEYTDYRVYLRDRFLQLKSENKNFSFRYFSKQAGFKSQSVLKQVIDGQSNIAPKSIEKYIRALKLKSDEAEFFENLVLMNQAKSSQEKELYAEKIIKLKKYQQLYPLSVAQLNYYQNWYYIPVRELVGLAGFRENPEWIAESIVPSITAQEVEKALADLLALGLIYRDAEGSLKQNQKDISTGDTVISELVRNYHRTMIKKGGEAIVRFSREDRDISAVALCVSDRDLENLKAMIRQFRKDIMRIAAQADTRNQLYQLNIQFFPLSRPTDKDSK